MGLPRTYRGSSGALAFLLCVGCGFAGLELSDNDSVTDPIGDGDLGDGDVGDGDTSLGGAGTGGLDGMGGDITAAGGMGGDGSGGLNGTGGLSGTGGLNGTGGSPIWLPLLYHDFEEGILPAEPTGSDNTMLQVVEENVFEGKYSLLASQPKDSMGAADMTFDLGDAPHEKLYLRAFLYVKPETLTGSVDLFRFSAEGGDSLSYGLNGEGSLRVTLPGGETSHLSATGQFQTGNWFCFRAEVQVSDAEGLVKMRVDDTEGLTTPLGDTRPGEGIVSFSYGIVESDSAGGTQIYFDNVTLSTVPIDCSLRPPAVEPEPL